ncbi:rhodanese-related sulfurtransferase [Alkalibacillus filiformis]|uniref:Rhodanese-related sulfurtransferase n=1 Tax=Alkalibacillus filiformis TaxID=200990 RepID=A0ABU0DWW4_9BACI|nr:rhodanese-like domain-containing protein [Alkalibacillus filiformis]MDQ0352954.1 rhodanese-related sulfurtransferase [Alkalibacillus filiformis]
MSEEVKEILPEELEKEIESGSKYTIVDVREDEEVATGMIPGAKHIALQTIPDQLNDLPKDEEYVMVCRSGGRSHNACMFLNERGYSTVNLKGGMLEWTGEKVF